LVNRPEQLAPNHLAILRHVGLYRLTLVQVVARLFIPFHDELSEDEQKEARRASAGDILNRLVDKGYLNHHSTKHSELLPPFPPNIPFFTLTPEGAQIARVPIERSETLGKKDQKKPAATDLAEESKPRLFGSEALQLALATLWFCTMYKQPRHRLEPEQLHKFFGKVKAFHNVPHCLAKTSRGLRIYRIYVPCVDKMRGVIPGIRKAMDRATSVSSIRTWAEQRDYGIAILAPDRAYCTDIETLVEQAKLTAEMHLIVRIGPTEATIASALKYYRNIG
jgi:hypothetical protein